MKYSVLLSVLIVIALAPLGMGWIVELEKMKENNK
jgi:hypothetical protein